MHEILNTEINKEEKKQLYSQQLQLGVASKLMNTNSIHIK